MGQATATRLDDIWGTAPTTVTTRKAKPTPSVTADHFGCDPGGIVAPKGTPGFEHSERTRQGTPDCFAALAEVIAESFEGPSGMIEAQRL